MLLLRVQPNEVGDALARELVQAYCTTCRELGYRFQWINAFEVELPDEFHQEIGRHRLGMHHEVCINKGSEMLRTYAEDGGNILVIDHTNNNERSTHESLLEFFRSKYATRSSASVSEA